MPSRPEVEASLERQREAFQRRLQYRFRDPLLLLRALTHRSADARHNERLEFLGDSLLGMFIAEALYAHHPDAAEGELSRMRSALVKEATLASVAGELQIGDILNLGSGELKSGGFRRASILADAMEAVIAAVYLDSDFVTCRDVVMRLFGARLRQLDDLGAGKDPKTRLQEWLQARQRQLPQYQLLQTEGEAHAQHFVVSCILSDAGLETRGEGSSRRRAEQAAAERMFAQLGTD